MSNGLWTPKKATYRVHWSSLRAVTSVSVFSGQMTISNNHVTIGKTVIPFANVDYIEDVTPDE